MLDNDSENNRADLDNDQYPSNNNIWHKRPTLNFILSLSLIILIAVSVIAAIFLVSISTSTSFTEFYLLGTDGKADNYPAVLNLGEEVNVTLGIVNHESSKQVYSVDVTIEGTEIESFGPITLGKNEKWENPVSFTPLAAGDNQTVEFILTRQIILSQNDNKSLSLKFNLDIKPMEEKNNEN